MNSILVIVDDNSGRSMYSLWNNVLFELEGIVWCIVYMLVFIFIVVGNLFIIVIFVLMKNWFCKKSLFFVINMVFVDLMLGVVFLFVYIYIIGVDYFGLWSGMMNRFLYLFYVIIDIVFL